MHAKDLYERLAAGYNYDPMYGELCTERDRLKKENALLRDLCEDMYRQCGASMGYDDPLLEELGIGC